MNPIAQFPGFSIVSPEQEDVELCMIGFIRLVLLAALVGTSFVGTDKLLRWRHSHTPVEEQCKTSLDEEHVGGAPLQIDDVLGDVVVGTPPLHTHFPDGSHVHPEHGVVGGDGVHAIDADEDGAPIDRASINGPNGR